MSRPQKTPTARLNDLGTRLALLDQAAGVSMTTGRVQFGAAWDIAVEALVEARALVEQLEAARFHAKDMEQRLTESDKAHNSTLHEVMRLNEQLEAAHTALENAHARLCGDGHAWRECSQIREVLNPASEPEGA